MKKVLWRLGLNIGVVGLLLIFDFSCKGPVSRKLASSKRSAELIDKTNAKKFGWVAVVNQEPITQAQLQVAVEKYLFRRGKSSAELPEVNLRSIRRAALQGLINDILIRQYADGDVIKDPSTGKLIGYWSEQFGTDEEKLARLETQKIGPAELNHELDRIESRLAWLDRRIAPAIEISDKEVTDWIEQNPPNPAELRKVSHIFLSTIEGDTIEKQNLIQEIYQSLQTENHSFEEAARTFSEDARSNKFGGQLGWLRNDRILPEFASKVFGMPLGSISEPFQTSLGWHIVRIDEAKTETIDPKVYRAEAKAAIETESRKETVRVLTKKLRTVANIVLFPENFD
ncbi:MAG: peptidylprolyl isomerase [Verrucomicrobiota bacterium]